MRFLSEKVVSNEADDATDAMEIVAAKSHVMVSDASTKEEKIEAMAVIMQKYNALLSHAAKFIVDFSASHVVRGLWARPIWADAAVSGAPCPTSLETAHSDLTRARTNVEKTLLRFARWFSPFLSHLEEGGEAPSLDELKARVPILAPLQGCEPPSSQPPYEGFERLAGSISPSSAWRWPARRRRWRRPHRSTGHSLAFRSSASQTPSHVPRLGAIRCARWGASSRYPRRG